MLAEMSSNVPLIAAGVLYAAMLVGAAIYAVLPQFKKKQ